MLFAMHTGVQMSDIGKLTDAREGEEIIIGMGGYEEV